jgi:hypothetical protein
MEGVMPKEVIFGEQTPEDTMVPIAEVRWNREGGGVQLVTKATDPHDGRVAGDSSETHVTDGFHVDLDRSSINKLIRNLRRARDQAFGKDE